MTKLGSLWYQGRSVDDVVAHLDDEDAEVVGLLCSSAREWLWVSRVIEAVRARLPRAVIAAGGPHVAAFPEHSLRDCPGLDLCVVGSLQSWVDVAGRALRGAPHAALPGTAVLQEGRFVHTPLDREAPPAASRPAWHLLPVDLYFASNGRDLRRCLPVSVRRPRGAADVPLGRRPAEIADDVECAADRYEVEHVDLVGRPAPPTREWLLELAHEIERRNAPTTWTLADDVPAALVDDRVAAALSRAGCRELTLAVRDADSPGGEPDGPVTNAASLKRAVAAGQRHGITLRTSACIGYPSDRRVDAARLGVLAARQALWRVDQAAVTVCMRDEPAPSPARVRGREAAPTRWRRRPASRRLAGIELHAWRLVAVAAFLALTPAARVGTLSRALGTVACQVSATLGRRVRDWSLRSLRHRLPVPGSR